MNLLKEPATKLATALAFSAMALSIGAAEAAMRTTTPIEQALPETLAQSFKASFCAAHSPGRDLVSPAYPGLQDLVRATPHQGQPLTVNCRV